MIIVTIELISGISGERRHLGTMTLANDATGSETVGHYNVTLSKWGRPNEPWRRGRVTNFPRKRLGPWDLLLAALRATVGGRAPEGPQDVPPPTPDAEPAAPEEGA